MINIIYSRVSKEDEKLQDIQRHEEKVCEKFNLKGAYLIEPEERIEDILKLNKPIILRERGSAYNMDKFNKRKELIKFLSFALDYQNTTIENLFLKDIKKLEINLYMWDSARLMRNIKYSLFLLLLMDLHRIRIFTFKDGELTTEQYTETPSKNLLRYLLFTILAYSGEEYSYTTSENIKKSVKKSHGIRIGTKKNPKGIKWGKPFTDINGERKEVDPKDIIRLQKRILQLDKEFSSYRDKYYPGIIKTIQEEFKVNISKSYITWIKNREN